MLAKDEGAQTRVHAGQPRAPRPPARAARVNPGSVWRPPDHRKGKGARFRHQCATGNALRAKKRGVIFEGLGGVTPYPPPPRGVPASFTGASLPPARGQEQLFAQGHDTGPIQPPASPRGPELLTRGEEADGRARAWGRRRRGRGRPPRPPKMEPPRPAVKNSFSRRGTIRAPFRIWCAREDRHYNR